MKMGSKTWDEKADPCARSGTAFSIGRETLKTFSVASRVESIIHPRLLLVSMIGSELQRDVQ